MNSMWMKTLALAASAVATSHAIFGIGGQWAPAPSLEIKSTQGNVAQEGTDSISVEQGGVSGLQGFGFKLWIDFLPFVDIEATTNIQWGMYDVSVVAPNGDRTDLNFDVGVPTVDKPGFARVVSDVSVLYPFLKLPPVVSLVKIYAGGGLTHVVASEVLNASFAKKAVAAAVDGNPTAADSPEKVEEILIDAIKEEGLKSGVGFHLMVGAKAKPPVIPIAAFVNLKYHFLSTMPSAVDANALTMEIGGALAF
jgi:hypothetical protein